MNSTKAYDIIIVGGGVIGLSAALAAQQRNLSVALLDIAALSPTIQAAPSRLYALNQASQNFLHALGIWEKLLDLSPFNHMHVWDVVGGGKIDFDSRAIGTDRLGTFIEEHTLKNALLQEVASSQIALFPNIAITAINPQPDHIVLHTKDFALQAKLLIAADGNKSMVRETLGVKVVSWPYHQQAIVAAVRNTKPHNATAYQVFLPTGSLAFLPMQDQYQSSIVWSTTTKTAQELMALDAQKFNHSLTTAFAGKLGESLLLSQRRQFPLIMQHVKKYSGDNWLLVGDAAHSIHPLAGLGLNLGFADLITWFALIDNNPKLNLKRQLGYYRRNRQAAAWEIIAGMEGIKTLFMNPLPPVTILRSMGLNACNNMLWLKRLFISQAAGNFLI